MLNSTFTWLDYSEQQRRRMLDVVSLFSESDTVDELGLSYARDGIADLLFPGTSSVQRGARYFLLIPWVYLRLENRRTTSAEITSRARSKEVELIYALLKSGEYTGVIGADKKDKLKRLASNIYWQGLRSWGICLFEGSQEQYHRSLDAFYDRLRRYNESRDDDGDAIEGVFFCNWHRGLPDPPAGFPEAAGLSLTNAEGRYLRDRILTTHPKCLLAELVKGDQPIAHCDYPWDLEGRNELPQRISDVLEHARNFSDVMHGAALLYNLLVAEKVPNVEWVAHYQQEISSWADRIAARISLLQKWDADQTWSYAEEGGHKAPHNARIFVSKWIEIVLHKGALLQVANNTEARELVANREIQLKRGMARLNNASARDRWNGASGTAPLSYRWSNVRTIVGDIQRATVGIEHA